MTKGLAVVTGASSGIGETFARRLARQGYDLLLIARRRDRLESLAAELARDHGIAADPLALDLTCDADLRTLEQRLTTATNLQLLVNNAGFGVSGRFYRASLDDLDRMHRLHVLATMRLTWAALQQLATRNTGAIINVSSVAGFIVSPGGAGYSATKAWINSFTEGIWLDLKTRGSRVRIQSLCPGFTYSEFHDTMGMDRSGVPKAWWTTSEFVVDASLDGLAADKLFVVPGWRYRLLLLVIRLVPASLRRAGSVWTARKIKRTIPVQE
jgi:short-subunit dehydrogenase